MTPENPQEKPQEAKPKKWKVSTEELSTNFRYTLEGVDAQFTVRGNPAGEELEAHFASARAAMKLVLEAGATAKPTPVAAPTGVPRQPEPTLAAVPGVVNTMRVIRLSIQPDADDETKTRAQLWEREKAEGHIYPDLTIAGPIERVLKALQGTGGWTAELMRVAKGYTVAWDVDWVESEKKNAKGYPYKNVVAIRVVE